MAPRLRILRRGRHARPSRVATFATNLYPDAVRRQLPLVVLTIGSVLAVLLHLAAGFHYPVLWDDEAHFIVPAQNLAQHLALTAPQLNAPAGIFWMPDGYAVALSLIFAILPDTTTTARLASLIFTLTFAGCLYAVVARLDGARLLSACLLAVWLVAPLVVLMANIARMEALVLGLVGTALLSVATGHWPAALAIASLAPLVHPMGFILIAAFVLTAIVTRARWRPSGRVETSLVTLAVLAWAAEAAWLASHLDLVRQHLHYQIARKLSYGLAPTGYEIAAGVLATIGLLGAAVGRARLGERRAGVIALTCALTGAFVAIRVTGNEMWYRVLGRETVLLFGGLTVALVSPLRRVISRWRLPAAAWVGAVLMAIVPVTAVAQVTVNGSAYGMALAAGTAERDRAFLAKVERELRAFDARQPHPKVVALDWSSGLASYLGQQRWSNLRFVDPTPVTPLYEPPDYVLFSVSPAEPDWRRNIEERTPNARPVLQLTSPDSHAKLIIYPGDLARLPIY